LRSRRKCQKPAYTNVIMTTLTARELEFLASLRTRWRELFLIEIARLMIAAAETLDVAG